MNYFKYVRLWKKNGKIGMQKLGTNKIQAVKYLLLKTKVLKKWNDVKWKVKLFFFPKGSFKPTFASFLSGSDSWIIVFLNRLLHT